MNRRQFLAASSALALSVKSAGGFTQDLYGGPYLIRVNAAGGWDLSLYCDPKVNQPNANPITNWSDEADIQFAGDIPFAPIGNNADAFERLGSRMMVINGVDTQTNAHQTGERHTWTGSAAEGRPSLTALFAAARAPDQPLSLLSFGGFTASADLIRPVMAADGLYWLTQPRPSVEHELLERFRSRGLDIVSQREQNAPWFARRIREYGKSHKSQEALSSLHQILPRDVESAEAVYKGESRLKAEAQTSLLAFKAGVAASAEINAGGNWDTHATGEFAQVSFIESLNNGLVYLWELAESLGIADQLIVVVSSDFGRTPYYNSYGGKDHWPINSYLIMESSPLWGNRVVGHTDEAQNASKVDPVTLKVAQNGSIIYPKHVHHALHRYLNIDGFARSVGYDFADTALYDFFNPSLTTWGPQPTDMGSGGVY